MLNPFLNAIAHGTRTRAIHHGPRRRGLLVLPVVVVAGLAGSATATATPIPATAAGTAELTSAAHPSTQGIIMRDGGICDPIRHMGC